jgi:glucokinase
MSARPRGKTVLAYDIGGSRIKAGLVAAGRLSSMTAVDTADSTSTGIVDQLIALGRTLAGPSPLEAVGVSVRGIIDPQSGELVDVNPPLRCLVGAPVAARLGAAFAAPVVVENDSRMYALGELRHGAGRGVENMVAVTLGTGIGVGVAIGGRMLRGRRGVLGILGGHFTVDVGGPPCTCGNRGCVETLIGARALVDYAAERLRAGVSSMLTPEKLQPVEIFAAANRGDRVGTATVERFTTVLGCAVVTLIHAYDPDVVVIGGGLSESGAQFLPSVREYVDVHAWTRPKGRVRLETAELGDSAALLGVAELVADEGWA